MNHRTAALRDAGSRQQHPANAHHIRGGIQGTQRGNGNASARVDGVIGHAIVNRVPVVPVVWFLVAVEGQTGKSAVRQCNAARTVGEGDVREIVAGAGQSRRSPRLVEIDRSNLQQSGPAVLRQVTADIRHIQAARRPRRARGDIAQRQRRRITDRNRAIRRVARHNGTLHIHGIGGTVAVVVTVNRHAARGRNRRGRVLRQARACQHHVTAGRSDVVVTQHQGAVVASVVIATGFNRDTGGTDIAG